MNLPAPLSRLLSRTPLRSLGQDAGAHGGYWRSVVTLMTGASAAQAIGMASMLVLARVYSPAEFGGYALFFVWSGLFALISTGKYDAAIFLARKQSEAADIAMLGILISLALGVLIALFSPLGGWLLGSITSHPTLFMICVGLAASSGGAIAALNAYATQIRNFKQITQCRIVQSVATAVISVVLGLLHWGELGLILGYVAGQLLSAAALIWTLAFLPRIRRFRWRAAKVRARRNKRFPQFMLLAEIINYFGVTLVQLVTPGLFGAAALGQFNLGQRVATLPITLIGQAMGSVFRSAISPQHTPATQIPALFRATFLRLCIAAGAFTLPLLLAGPPIFRIVLGPKWAEAGFYVQILAPLIFCRFAVSPMTILLLLAGKQRFDTLLQCMYVVASLLAIGIGMWFDSFTAMVAAYSALQTLVFGIYLAISYRLALDLAAKATPPAAEAPVPGHSGFA